MAAELIPLSPGLSVAGRLERADIDALAQAGVRTIVNNRPDGEDPGQVPAAEARRLAEAHGIAYHHIPITAASLTRADVDAFAAALRERRGAGRRPLPQRHPLDPLMGVDPDARGRRSAQPDRRGRTSRHRHRQPAGGRGAVAPARRLTPPGWARSPGHFAAASILVCPQTSRPKAVRSQPKNGIRKR